MQSLSLPITTNNTMPATSLSSLFSLHILSKCLTFLTTIIITRLLPSPSLKGHIFTLQLFKSCLGMLVGREAFYACFVRKGLQRRDAIIWWSQCLLLTLYLYLFYHKIPSLKTIEDKLLKTNMESHYAFHVMILAIVLELLVEPYYVVSQHMAQFQLRMKIEGLALFTKCFLMYTYLRFHQKSEISQVTIEWAYVVSELMYGVVVFGGYLMWSVRGGMHWRGEELKASKVLKEEGSDSDENEKESRDTAASGAKRRKSSKSQPKGDASSSEQSSSSSLSDGFKTFLSFYVYDVFRFILTEGEKFALIWFSSLKERGVYDLVFNLGSLVVRLLFQPIEQVAFTTWSRILHSESSAQDKSSSAQEDHEETENKKRHLDEALFFLRNLLKLMCIIALIFMCFGPPYSFSLLRILYGSSWTQTDAPFLLQIYCIYVGFLALNGVSEAFVRAASSGKTLRRYSGFMTIFSIVYISACGFLTYLGMETVSLIISNCINMICRIVYNFLFIREFFFKRARNFSLRDILPQPFVLMLFVTSFVVCQALESSMREGKAMDLVPLWIVHLVLGMGCFAVTMGALWHSEKDYFRQLRSLLR